MSSTSLTTTSLSEAPPMLPSPLTPVSTSGGSVETPSAPSRTSRGPSVPKRRRTSAVAVLQPSAESPSRVSSAPPSDESSSDSDDTSDEDSYLTAVSWHPSLRQLFLGAVRACERIEQRGGRRFRPPAEDGFSFATPLHEFPEEVLRSMRLNCPHFSPGGGICDFCRFRQRDLLDDALALRRARRASIASVEDVAFREPAPDTQAIVDLQDSE